MTDQTPLAAPDASGLPVSASDGHVLTWRDRLFVGFAGTIENAVLRFVPSQPIVRRIFALTGPLGAKKPRGTAVIHHRDGSVEFRPPGIGADAPLLVYFHGGGFTIGSPLTHAGLIAHLAQAAGMRAIAPDYRLAPEHPYPAAVEDCWALYQRLVDQGTPPTALAGDSAGGTLTLQIAVKARDAGLPLPKRLGLLAPIADFSGDITARFEAAEDEILIPPHWPARIKPLYLGARDPSDPEISPLLGDLSGLPPSLIQAASGEALSQDARQLSEAMEHARVDLWDGLPHVWHLHAGLMPAADRALAQMGAFLAGNA